MAVTLGKPPSIAVTAHADTDAVRYDVNSETNKVTVYIDGQAGDIALTGTDGAAIVAASWPIVADAGFEFRVDAGPDRVTGLVVFVAVDVATDVRIFSEAD